jgi:protein required for attachment to host cells
MTIETWILVADAAGARVMRASAGTSAFELVCEETHEEGRAKPGELVSDRPGRSFDSTRAGGRHAMEPDTDLKRAELQRFVRRLAAMLDEAAAAGRFGELVLVAPPRFLGELRAALPERVAGRVRRELDKDLAHLGAAELQRRLADLLRP